MVSGVCGLVVATEGLVVSLLELLLLSLATVALESTWRTLSVCTLAFPCNCSFLMFAVSNA